MENDVLVLNDQGGGIMSISDKPATLRAQMKHHEPIVCYAVKTKQIDMRTSERTAHPLDGNDDKEPQAVCYSPPPAAFMGGQGAKARSIAYCDDGTTPTLKAAMSGGNTVPDVVYPVNLMVATRGGKDDMRTCFGIGEPGDPQFTLSAAHEHGVCYEAKDGRN